MSRSSPSQPHASRPKRPASVTWLAVAVFCLAGVNAGRVGVTLTGWDLWTGFGLPFPLPLRVALSAAWAVTLGGVAWGLRAVRPWARHWALALFPLYQLYELGWRLAFVGGDYERGRLPFVLATGAAVTLVVMWILTRQRVKHEFELGSKPRRTANDEQRAD